MVLVFLNTFGLNNETTNLFWMCYLKASKQDKSKNKHL